MSVQRVQIFALLAAIFAILGGCRTRTTQADYVFAYLKTGPATKTGKEREAIFRGHMANIQRLADEGKLLIAGPFIKPRDKNWRGIFVLNVKDTSEAQQLVDSDPGVASGVFVTELQGFRASELLRSVPDCERQMEAEIAATRGEKPAAMRGYVMITSSDMQAAKAFIRASPLANRVVWFGTFADGGGVFAIDSASAEEVSAIVDSHAGIFGVDGWYSSASLMRLPDALRGVR